MMSELGCPFVGLVPYTEGDARFFFGRARETQQVIANLFASRLTLLYGASGVGKSSLLRAGVLDALARRAAQAALSEESPEEVAIYLKDWQGDVLARFREALQGALVKVFPDAGEMVSADEMELADIVSAVSERTEADLLVILDQFEEYFLYHGEEEVEDEPFARQLAAAINRPGLPASFLAVLRDDALARLDRFKTRIPGLFSNYLRLRPLAESAGRKAIVESVRVYNELAAAGKSEPVQVEPELEQAVVRQVRRGEVQIGEGERDGAVSDEMEIEASFLQLVMKRVWEEEIGGGSRVLRARTLEDLGGVEKIVHGHFDRVMAELSADDRWICARIFQHLVTPSGAKIVHTAADLAEIAGVELGRMEPLLARISGSEMRVLMPVVQAGAVTTVHYQIFHDALARAMLEWQRRYVEERQRQELEKERRRRRFAFGSAVVMALILIFSLYQMWRAEANAQRAREQEGRATVAGQRASNLAKLLQFEVPGLGMRFVPISAGGFRMGSPADEPRRGSDEALHQVKINRAFWMTESEVTQGQWRSVIGNNPSRFAGCGAECPVESVTWFDAVAFANRLSELEGLDGCYRLSGCKNSPGNELRCQDVGFAGLECLGYRLPTEAEWEYAARAGTATPFWTGGNLTTAQANYKGTYPYADHPRGEYREQPVAVRSFEPNPWDLYEIHGNVLEWVHDWYGQYPEKSEVDHGGPEQGSYRVVRGGSWVNPAHECRSAHRFASLPSESDGMLGFRVVKIIPEFTLTLEKASIFP